jgi:hypothetical protein
MTPHIRLVMDFLQYGYKKIGASQIQNFAFANEMDCSNDSPPF